LPFLTARHPEAILRSPSRIAFGSVRYVDNNDVILVLSTASSEKEAVTIAQALVDQELAACVNIVPAIRSLYRWKGKIWNEVENMLFIKTTSAQLEELKKTIKELHSYELPEVLALRIDDGEKNVLNWIGSSVKGGREKY
jgi:periplasmic divalent cation tolerance protein